MSQIKVLIAEDDKNLGIILKAFLDSKGFTTSLATNGEEAFSLFNTNVYDLCLLDVTMPVVDGFSLAKRIKAMSPTIPIVFLTARKEQEDILEGFRIGADDYITKPFSMDELYMRLKAIHRRCSFGQVQSSVFQLGGITFNAARHELIKGNNVKKLTSKESDLLLMLCENLGSTTKRSTALLQIWKEESYLNARSMDVYITKLRKYLKDEPNVQLENVHGVGFKLVVK